MLHVYYICHAGIALIATTCAVMQVDMPQPRTVAVQSEPALPAAMQAASGGPHAAQAEKQFQVSCHPWSVACRDTTQDSQWGGSHAYDRPTAILCGPASWHVQHGEAHMMTYHVHSSNHTLEVNMSAPGYAVSSIF